LGCQEKNGSADEITKKGKHLADWGQVAEKVKQEGTEKTETKKTAVSPSVCSVFSCSVFLF